MQRTPEVFGSSLYPPHNRRYTPQCDYTRVGCPAQGSANSFHRRSLLLSSGDNHEAFGKLGSYDPDKTRAHTGAGEVPTPTFSFSLTLDFCAFFSQCRLSSNSSSIFFALSASPAGINFRREELSAKSSRMASLSLNAPCGARATEMNGPRSDIASGTVPTPLAHCLSVQRSFVGISTTSAVRNPEVGIPYSV